MPKITKKIEYEARNVLGGDIAANQRLIVELRGAGFPGAAEHFEMHNHAHHNKCELLLCLGAGDWPPDKFVCEAPFRRQEDRVNFEREQEWLRRQQDPQYQKDLKKEIIRGKFL